MKKIISHLLIVILMAVPVFATTIHIPGDYPTTQAGIDGASNGGEYTLEGTGEITIPTEETFTLERKAIIPNSYALHQNYPNPFNPITSLRYDLPEQAQVTLTIYDLMGREVTQLVNTTQKAGFKSVHWDATDMHGKPVSAGVYLYQIRTPGFVQTRKMVLLK